MSITFSLNRQKYKNVKWKTFFSTFFHEKQFWFGKFLPQWRLNQSWWFWSCSKNHFCVFCCETFTLRNGINRIMVLSFGCFELFGFAVLKCENSIKYFRNKNSNVSVPGKTNLSSFCCHDLLKSRPTNVLAYKIRMWNYTSSIRRLES